MADAGIKFSLDAIDGFSKTFGKFGSSMKSMTAIAATAGAAVGGLATGLFVLTKNTASAVDEMAKFASRIGITTEALSELRHAADLSGLSGAQLQMALQRMTRRAAEAAQGMGEAQGALRELGIDAKAFGKLAPDQQFQAFAKAIDGVSSQSDRLRLAFKLFDSEGTGVLQMLTKGSAGLSEMRAEAEALGLSVSADFAADAADFNDSMTRFSGSLTGLTNIIAAEFMPTFANAFNAMARGIIKIRPLVADFAESWLMGLQIILDTVVDVVANVYKAFGVLPEVWQFLKISFTQTANAILKGLDWILDKAIGFMEAFNIGGVLDDSIAQVTTWKTSIGGAIDLTTDKIALMEQEWSNMTIQTAEYNNRISDMRDNIKGFIGDLIETSTESAAAREAQVESVAQAAETIKTISDDADASVAQLMAKWVVEFPSMAQQIADLMQSTFDGLASGIGNAFANAIIDGENLAEGIKNVLKDVAKNIIAMLIKIGIQRLILAGISRAVGLQQFIGEMGQGAAKVWINSFASAAAIPGIGWAIAPQVANANTAIAVGGIGVTAGIGAAAGAAVGGGIAHAGLTDVPYEGTFLLDKGERVVAPEQNRDLTNFLANGGGGGSVIVEKISILENATNASAMLSMSDDEWRGVTEEKIMPALRALGAMA